MAHVYDFYKPDLASEYPVSFRFIKRFILFYMHSPGLQSPDPSECFWFIHLRVQYFLQQHIHSRLLMVNYPKHAT